jgi:hypothetical protein
MQDQTLGSPAVNHAQAVLFGLVGALVFAAHPLGAAEEGRSTAADHEDDKVQVPEIIINGHKEKLSQLQTEVYKAEDDFFEAFNRVNTDPEFETHCGFELPIDSHIQKRVCRPQFVNDSTEEDMLSHLDSRFMVGPVHPGRPANMEISHKMSAYRNHIRDLVRNDPELRKALGQYYALAQQYNAVFKQKLKGKWFVWD